MTDTRHLIFLGVLTNLCLLRVKTGFVTTVYAQLSLYMCKFSFAKYSNSNCYSCTPAMEAAQKAAVQERHA